MTRTVPIHRVVSSGPFLYERMPQGLKAIHSAGFMYGLKPVPTSHTYGAGGAFSVKRQYSSERTRYLRGRKKAVPQGPKPSLGPVRCGTVKVKAVPFVQPDRIKQRITGAQQASRGCLMTLRIETTHYSRLRNTRNR
jgi:hypothetical protein